MSTKKISRIDKKTQGMKKSQDLQNFLFGRRASDTCWHWSSTMSCRDRSQKERRKRREEGGKGKEEEGERTGEGREGGGREVPIFTKSRF